MNLLLDTHVLLWFIDDSRRLGRKARAAIVDARAMVYISAVSIWELSIKAMLDRPAIKGDPEKYVRRLLEIGFLPLPINFEHALAVRLLPLHHADPFDRMLIAQAETEGLTLLTADSQIEAYRVPTFDASE